MLRSLDDKTANNIGAILVTVLVIAAVVVGGYALVSSGALGGLSKSDTASKAAAPAIASGYVAVFLSNKQVYFGKLKDAESAYPTLTDVFYLRVSQTLAPGSAGSVQKVSVAKTDKDAKDKTATPAATPVSTGAPQLKNELTLIKLGAEIHGPTDSIRINRDHILFVETLKDDSKVVKAITDYRAKNK